MEFFNILVLIMSTSTSLERKEGPAPFFAECYLRGMLAGLDMVRRGLGECSSLEDVNRLIKKLEREVEQALKTL